MSASVSVTVGDVRITRIEELTTAFPLEVFLPTYDADRAGAIGMDKLAPYMDPDGTAANISVHSWLVQTPRKTILIDTCNGNHKTRNMDGFGDLDLPWLDTLAAEGVQPGDVDAVVCTHIHLDHVGWNTHLVDGEWVPTFPNATFYFNKTEFEFWMPSNPGQEPFEFNANVFADSVEPVFDREMVQIWDGDLDIDEVFHLEMATGHTPGQNICWLESKGEKALFAADTIHSPLQVFEPSWNCGFDADPAGAHETRVKMLESCVEANALLLPAHFPAPHVYRVESSADGFVPVPVTD